MPSPLPLLYEDLAGWFHLLSPPEEYAEEVAVYRPLLKLAHPAERLLELGSGAGCNAFHLKRDFACTLTDVSPAMLEASRRINPECEHIVGDMRTLRLERHFDVVFVHDAVMYMTTEDDLHRAMTTAFVHCRPGGVVLFAPDCVKETFRPATDCGGTDGDGRALRYLEWTWDPDPADTTYFCDFVYALREGHGEPRVVRDRHVEGVFARATWLRLLERTGFRAHVGPPRGPGPESGELFVAVRP
jgi:SAM-dependent methyltransferase